MSCRQSDKYDGADVVCPSDVKIGPKEVWINALEDAMPECTRREGASRLQNLDAANPRSVCYVYCAQRSCGAATEFLSKHSDELKRKCASVAYVPGGALEMDSAVLVDGDACHANIVAHNMKEGLQDGCLTCQGDQKVPIPVRLNNKAVKATYMPTSATVPDWYHRSGIVGSLPTQFSCDPKYRGQNPTPHQHGGSSSVLLDISKTGLPSDTLLAYWAAQSSTDIVVAEKAYGSFNNSGIVQCQHHKCAFSMNTPGQYTAEGKVFKRHIHVTEWLGDRWNLRAKTIDFE